MVVPAMFRLNEFNSKMADGGEGKRRRKRDTEPTWLLQALQEMIQSDSGGTKMCLWNQLKTVSEIFFPKLTDSILFLKLLNQISH